MSVANISSVAKILDIRMNFGEIIESCCMPVDIENVPNRLKDTPALY